ncbi:LLM class flavin-dependent oxidoreductase [Bradyrhizobium oropedii]|uniref:LLM class flavin-dependent oxidoreductase n=1 Tax=Bradyrhizobium oropedii TaxID=1571201 RepID=UPI00237C4C65|nr:LLM class flavin-dependent oxidoreductase [Bradyrhizobium oropedii]
MTEQLSREERYERADEFIEVVTKLWNSWEDGALIRDRQTPLFADPAWVHRIDHSGKWFNVQGPLNVSRPPQGRPVFIQAGASDRGRDFAARWAEIIFVTPGLMDVAVERDPDTIKVLPGIVPVIGDTEKEAKALHDQLHELSHPESGLSTLSYHLGVDLSRFPQDQVLPENLDVPGVEGHYREVSELTRRSGLSLAELGQRYGAGRTTSGFAGTPGSVADRMQEWFEAGACDGFMLQVPYPPGRFGGVGPRPRAGAATSGPLPHRVRRGDPARFARLGPAARLNVNLQTAWHAWRFGCFASGSPSQLNDHIGRVRSLARIATPVGPRQGVR